ERTEDAQSTFVKTIVCGPLYFSSVPQRLVRFQPLMPARPLLYLIDGSSQMYRAFHAPVRTADGGMLRNAAGVPTNAVYIFVTMLRKLLTEHKPAYIAASFDLPGRTFRDDMVSDYKANRAPMPGELAVQIPMVHAACEALGVPILTSERSEEHTSELQSRRDLVCRLLLEKKKE